MFYDNRCMQRRGNIATKKCLFRLSRIVNRTVSYHLTKLNCDHMSTYNLTGHLAWATAIFMIDPLMNIPSARGEINEDVILKIEEQTGEPHMFQEKDQ